MGVKSLGYVFPGLGPLIQGGEIMSHLDSKSSNEILFRVKQLWMKKEYTVKTDSRSHELMHSRAP